jgi:PilZ domain
LRYFRSTQSRAGESPGPVKILGEKYDGICVAEPDRKEGERRRSPRFACSGRATIQRLPFDGTAISGVLRNLSLGGICLDLAEAVEPGARTEVLVSVHAESFRAAALVARQREFSGTSLQFVQIGSTAKDVLADLLARLERLQMLNRRLRSARIDETTERMLREPARIRLVNLRESGIARAGGGIGAARNSSIVDAGDSAEGKVVEPELIRIDLFI